MEWYEQEVRGIERRLRRDPPPPGSSAFYGGSSIRLWGTLREDFPAARPINLGFGGATLEACAHFFDRLVTPVRPGALILYAGDNDLGDGRSPTDVLDAFRGLAGSAEKLPGPVEKAFLAIKPSPARRSLQGAIREANRLVRDDLEARPSWSYLDIHTPMLDDSGEAKPELYVEDGLHLSAEGYRLWAELLRNWGPLAT